MDKLLPVIVIIIGFLFFNQTREPTKSIVDPVVVKAQLAHNLTYLSKNKPIIDVIPDQPDTIPDLANCPICKGTRVQTHADGHKTPCPYHGTSMEELFDEIENLSLRLTERDSKLELLQHDLIATRNKLNEIDKLTRQPQLTVSNRTQYNQPAQLKKTYLDVRNQGCPCGCRHSLGNCTCRASCPGKAILRNHQQIIQQQPKPQPQLKPQPKIQQKEWTDQEYKDSIRYSGQPPTYVIPKAPQAFTTYYRSPQQNFSPVMKQSYSNYSSSGCSGGNCSRRSRRG